MKRIFRFTLLLILIAPGCRSGMRPLTVEHENRKRTYFIVKPASEPTSIVFVLHGGSGTADKVQDLVPDVRGIASNADALLVFPQGVDKAWNDGRGDPISTAHKEKIDDSGFLTNLARSIKSDYRIADDRVFTMGISNGGMMSLRLLCDSDVFSGGVIIAAQMQIDYMEKCRLTHQPKVLFILGTKDPLIPYDGGPVRVLGRKRGVVLSGEKSATYWREKNQCNPTVIESKLPDKEKDETTARRQDWNCARGSVSVIHVENGGHTWPGGKQYLPEMIIGKTSRDFSATEIAFQWFGIGK